MPITAAPLSPGSPVQNLPFSVFRSHPVMREEAELSLGSPLWLEAAGRRWIAEQAPSEVSSGLLAQASQKGPRPWSSGCLGQAGPPERQGAVLGPSSGPRQPPARAPGVTGREAGLQMEKEDGASQGPLDEDEIPAPGDLRPRPGQLCHPTSSPCARQPHRPGGEGTVQGKGSHTQK